MTPVDDGEAPLTRDELAQLCGGRVAYLKPMRSEEVNRLFREAPAMRPGLSLFALLAADGSPIALTQSRDAAFANARENELEMASLH
ncbi:DUF1150 family protein [Methylocella sp.]|uniref:BQ00720 family protein n=1 Tax=Methylocella sp. TaxID=1978226 RepID=UPI0035B24EF6